MSDLQSLPPQQPTSPPSITAEHWPGLYYPSRYFGAICVAATLAWVWLSASLLSWQGLGDHRSLMIAGIKDSLFIIVVAGGVLWLIHRHLRAVHQTAQLLRAVADGTTDAVFVKNAEGKYLLFNAAASHLVGKPIAEVLGRDDAAVFDDESARVVREYDRQVMAKGETQTNEEALCASGVTRIYQATKAPYRDKHGHIIGIIGVSRDITESKRIENMLREQETFIRSVLDSINTHIAVLDRHGTIVEVNEAWRTFAANNPQLDGLAGRPAVGTSYIAMCEASMQCEAHAVYQMLRTSVADERFVIEYMCESSHGPRWFLLNITPLTYRAGGVIVMHTNITQRKQAELELAVSEQRFRQLADAIPQMVWIAGPDGGLVHLNAKAVTYTGVSLDQLVGWSWENVIHPDDLPPTLSAWATILSTGVPKQLEFRIRRAGGEYRCHVAHQVPVKDEAGAIVTWYGTCVDVEDFKQAELALRRERTLLRTIIDTIPDLVYTKDLNERYGLGNRALLDFVGQRSVDDIRGKSAFDFYPHELARQYHHDNIRVLQHGETVQDHEELARDASGHTTWRLVYKAPLRDDTGAIIGLVGVSRDIQQRKERESLLAESQTRLNLALSAARLGTWDWDLQTGEVTRSPECLTILGVTQLANHHEAFERLIHPEDRDAVEETYQRAIRNRSSFVVEFRMVRPNGDICWVSESGRPQVHDEQAVRLIGVLQDLTAQRRLEAQFRQAQKLEAIGRLAGGVAHDFNNLLTVINGYGDLLMLQTTVDDPRREAMMAIRDAGERATRLTQQLLAFSRKAIVESKVLDLNLIVTESAKMLRRLISESIQLIVIADPHLANIKADPGQIEQVVMNLVINSRDAMLGGGQITVETRNIVLPQEAHGALTEAPAGRYVMLSISDTGQGMSDDVKSKIFEPFFTTKSLGQGTGLGLAVVHGVVKQCNGFIDLESQPGQGTMFRLLFPATTEEGQRLSDSVFKRRTQGNETVLLVEDDSSVRRIALIALETFGFHVLQASNGPDAIQVAKNYEGHIHIVVTDVVMPEMGGRQLVDALLADRPQLQVLYMSGYTDDDIFHQGGLLISDAFLQKPFTPLIFARKVRAILDEVRTTA